MPFPNPFLQSIRSRLPNRSDALRVFSVVLFAVFGWSIRGFLYKMPAFTLYFGVGSNLAILSYMFAFALIESLLVMAILLGVAALLPGHFLRDGFGYKGFIIVLVATVAMIVFEGWYKVEFFKDIMAGDESSIQQFVIGAVLFLVLLLGVLLWVRTQPRLQGIAALVAEQLSVFTFIYVPLGLIGLIVILIRNL